MSLTELLARVHNYGLESLRLPELRQVATAQGLKAVSGLRKGELVAAIESAGTDFAASCAAAAAREKALVSEMSRPQKSQPRDVEPPKLGGDADLATTAHSEPLIEDKKDRPVDTPNDEKHEASTAVTSAKSADDFKQSREPREEQSGSASAENHENRDSSDNRDNSDNRDGDDRGDNPRRNRRNRRARRRAREREFRDNNQDGDNANAASQEESSEGGSKNNDGSGQSRGDRGNRGERNDRRERRNRNRRERNRNGDNNSGNGNNDANVEPEELTTVAGVVDFADANTAFIRTTGYHSGPSDIYVPPNLLRKSGMRHGDAIRGTVRPRGAAGNAAHTAGRGRNRQKYVPLYQVTSINGMAPEEAAKRPEFSKLTPLYPNQRLRLETDPKTLTTRVIDLIMPIGKGQRALIVSPPKAGKTTILQDIANAISANNPECYLMVVLVDERPEEVTDMQRSVRGEVIASTFDRPPSEHTKVAELAVERAKRLVEQGHDVVLLLDSITRLGRAYNNSSPASGRILSGGVDSNALYPPKRFLGAARNIENGGSLTIIATAMVETGSAGDTVIFEEFKGTGNAELKLDRRIAERRVFPAVDVNPSGTRKDELLLGPEEARIMHKLRRILSALEPEAAIDLLIKQLRKAKTNRDFLMQVASSAPLAGDEDND